MLVCNWFMYVFLFCLCGLVGWFLFLEVGFFCICCLLLNLKFVVVVGDWGGLCFVENVFVRFLIGFVIFYYLVRVVCVGCY